MFEIITRLRARPIAYRRRVAFFVALGITMVIGILWVISLLIGPGPQEAPRVEAVPGPFEAFVGQVRGGVSSIRTLLTEWGE